MKNVIYTLIFLMPFCAFCHNTVGECDKAVKLLVAERNKLRSVPAVVFRAKDDRKSNVARRLGVVEVNRAYAPLDKRCSFAEYQKLLEQVKAYQSATNRIAAIDEEIKAIKDERKRLSSSPVEVVR